MYCLDRWNFSITFTLTSRPGKQLSRNLLFQAENMLFMDPAVAFQVNPDTSLGRVAGNLGGRSPLPEVHLIPVLILSLEIRQKFFFPFIEYTTFCHFCVLLLSQFINSSLKVSAAGLPALSSQSHRLLIKTPPTPPADSDIGFFASRAIYHTAITATFNVEGYPAP